MTRVFIADDHALVRAGLRGIIEAAGDMAVVGEASDGAGAIAAVQAGELDVVMLDLSMPGKSGLDLVRHIRAIAPRLPILVLSMHGEDQFAVRAIRAGASGYLGKDSAPRQLLTALRKVAAGGVYLSPAATEHMAIELAARAGASPDTALHAALTERELEVFVKLASGRTVSEIAAEMNLSIKTVSTHKTHIMEKIKCRTLVELGRYAAAHGIGVVLPETDTRGGE